MKKFLFFGALLGWALSFGVHLTTLNGMDVSKSFPVMVLHAGIFIILIPATIILRQNPELKQFEALPWRERMGAPLFYWKVIFRYCPVWLRIFSIGFFIYGFSSFFIRMTGNNAQFTLLFSGHWMAFYAIAMAMMYPFTKRNVL